MREDGIRYEQFCCEYLEQRGYSTKTTQTTGDQGVDVIAVKDGIKYAIQCKYRVDGLVGNDAVQQVVSGKEFYDCDIAVVMTNTTFTSKAKELADKIHVKIWDNIDFPKKEDGNIENTTLLDANVVKKEKIINAYISKNGIDVLSRMKARYIQFELALERKTLLFDHEIFKSEYETFPPFEYFEKEEGIDLFVRRLLEILNECSTLTFYVRNYISLQNNIISYYLFESDETVQDYLINLYLQKLQTIYLQEFEVSRLTSKIICVRMINVDRRKDSNLKTVNDFIVSYLKDNVENSRISKSKEIIVSYQTAYNSPSEEYPKSEVRVFHCSELLDDRVISNLEKILNEQYQNKMRVKRINKHRFSVEIDCIDRTKGKIVSVNLDNVLNCELNERFSVDVYKSVDSIYIYFVVKKINIKKLLDKEIYGKYKERIRAYINLIETYTGVLRELLTIEWYKTGLFDVRHDEDTDKVCSPSIQSKQVVSIVLDTNFDLISFDHIGNYTDNGIGKLSFPIIYSDSRNIINKAGYDLSNISYSVLDGMLFLDVLDHNRVGIDHTYFIDQMKMLISDYFHLLESQDYKIRRLLYDVENLHFDNDVIHRPRLYAFEVNALNIFEEEMTNELCCDRLNICLYSDYYVVNLLEETFLHSGYWGLPHTDYDDLPRLFDFIKEPICQLSNMFEMELENRQIEYEHIGNKNIDYDCSGTFNSIYSYYRVAEVSLENFNEFLPEMIENININKHGDLKLYWTTSCFMINEGCFVYVMNNYTNIFDSERFLLLSDCVSRREINPQMKFVSSEVEQYCEFELICHEDDVMINVNMKGISIKPINEYFISKEINTEIVWNIWNVFVYCISRLSVLHSKETFFKNDVFPVVIVNVFDSEGNIIMKLVNGKVEFSYFLHRYDDDCIDSLDFGIHRFEVAKQFYTLEIIPKINKLLIKAIQLLKKITDGCEIDEDIDEIFC